MADAAPTPGVDSASVASLESSVKDIDLNADSKDVVESKDFETKHPLQYKWTMWYNPPPNRAAKNPWVCKEVLSFDTVEDFWCLYNNLPKPSQIQAGSNYHLFKEGIKPEWEHEANKAGGKWVVTFKKEFADLLDDAWLYTVLAIIGEHFENSDEICGAVISPRAKQNHRLALWIRSSKIKEVCQQIGQSFKDNVGWKQTISFQAHAASLSSGSSRGVSASLTI